MRAMASQITSLTSVCSIVYSGADQNIKAPRHWPLWGEFTGDRWIPRTKGQWRGNVSIWWRHRVSFCTDEDLPTIHHCDTGNGSQIAMNCNDYRVIRVDRVYFGTTESLSCPPPRSCGAYDFEETGRLRLNCNGLPTCTWPANFVRVNCQGHWVDSFSVFVSYDCVQGKRFCGCLRCKN